MSNQIGSRVSNTLNMKTTLCILIILGSGFGMNVPQTTTLPKQPREESTTLPKNLRGGVTDATNLGDLVEPIEPSFGDMDLLQERSSPLRCGQTVDLEAVDKAVFQTKYFGYGYYPPRQECEWTLEAPAGATLKLFFSFFDVARGDYFIVRGKDYYWGSIWQPFSFPLQLGPNENSISFKFQSNRDTTRGWGFRFLFRGYTL